MRAPPSLLSLRQWINWRTETRGDKPTKVPINPHTGALASVTDPTTWGSYDEAKSHDPDHLGFVFTGSDPFVAIDLDGCRDPKTGALAPWAKDIVTLLDSYTEVSPSGTGAHILIRGTWAGRGRKHYLPNENGSNKTPAIEVYGQGRFFTVTGTRLVADTSADVQDRASALDALRSRYFSDDEADLILAPLPDARLPLRLGDRLTELVLKGWHEDCGFPSPSELDFAVATELLRNGHTPGEVVWVFTHPTFGFSRGKHRRTDYIQRTIAAAQGAVKSEPAGSGLSGLTVSELRALPMEEDKPLVDRLVFDQSITLVSGPPKLGKTMWVMQLMASLAEGKGFLDTFAVPEPATSLHMTAELPVRRYRDRWERFFHVLYPEAEPRIVVCSDKAISLDTDFDRICALIETSKPRLVVFDPWIRYHNAKDENDNAAMAQAMKHLDRLIEKYGVAILIVHHLRKRTLDGGGEEMEAIRGAGVMRSHPNINITLVPKDTSYGEDEIVKTVKMRVESNFSEPERPLYLVRGEHGLFERDGIERRAAVSEAITEILKSVSDHRLDRKTLIKRVTDNFGMTKAAVERALDGTFLPAGISVDLQDGVKRYRWLDGSPTQ